MPLIINQGKNYKKTYKIIRAEFFASQKVSKHETDKFFTKIIIRLLFKLIRIVNFFITNSKVLLDELSHPT
jgi:hypothetical protein